VSVKSRDLHTVQRRGGGIRRPVMGFSSKSRLNLLRLVSRLRDVPALFITLTYRQNLTDHAAAKRHLDLALRWISRQLPRSAILWRMEYQRRGAIHFHLIVFDAYGLPLADFTAYWQRMTGDNSYPDVKYVQGNRRRILAYVAKYVAKPDGLDSATNSEVLSQPGRYWGVFARRFLPLADVLVMHIIHAGVLYDFRRLVRRYLRGRVSGKFLGWLCVGSPMGFSLFVGDASQWHTLFGQVAADWYDM
jgi:hypothetical protein